VFTVTEMRCLKRVEAIEPLRSAYRLPTNCFNYKNLIAEFKFVKNKILDDGVSDTIKAICEGLPTAQKSSLNSYR
jgi:hypothetical protein